MCRYICPRLFDSEIRVASLRPSDDEMFLFQFKRKQFPIRLRFTMAINKASYLQWESATSWTREMRKDAVCIYANWWLNYEHSSHLAIRQANYVVDFEVPKTIVDHFWISYVNIDYLVFFISFE